MIYWTRQEDPSEWKVRRSSLNLRWPWLARLVARVLNFFYRRVHMNQ